VLVEVRKPKCYTTLVNGQEFRFVTLEDGTDMLSRNVGKELMLLAA